MKFEDPPQTRAWGKEYYDCHYGIIEWGDIEVFNELLCKERTVWISETIRTRLMPTRLLEEKQESVEAVETEMSLRILSIVK